MSSLYKKILSVSLLSSFLFLFAGCSSSSGDSPAVASAPVITLNGANPMTVNVSDTFIDPGATAMDDVDGDLSTSIKVDSNVDTAVAGDYTVAYSVTDSDGNSANAVRNVVVTDVAILSVPERYTTIGDALANAADGDTILLAPGTYDITETLFIDKNNITIASMYLTTGDESYIGSTIIRANQATKMIDGVLGQSANLRIIGLSLIDGDKGVTFTDDYGEVHYCRFSNMLRDSVSFDNDAGGAVTHCKIDRSGDDAIDIDTRHDRSFLIAYNELTNSGDDGIEIHLYPHSGTMMHYDIHDNLLWGAREDGLQLIDYDDKSDRTFDVYRNIFRDIRDVAIGSMTGVTLEDFQGSPIKERVNIYNNYFSNNGYHITGGDNMIVLNNIFEAASGIALHRVKTDSIADYNLFYSNGSDISDSLTGSNNLYNTDPLRENDFTLQTGSPAIDAGTASYAHQGNAVFQSSTYVGLSPDIGRYEYGLSATAPLTRAGYIKRSSEDAAVLGDLEAFVYVGADSSFVITDDIKRQIYWLDLATETVTDIKHDSEFGAYAWENPGGFEPINTSCSVDPVTGVLTGFCDPEAVAYDQRRDELYVFTGNHPGDLTGFQLSRSAPGGTFAITGWKRIVQAYTAAIFIDNQFYVAITDPVTNAGKIVSYDWGRDRVGSTIFTIGDEIEDLAYANGTLWLLTAPDMLYRIRYSDMQILDAYDMHSYDIKDPRGVEVVGGKLYIGDGYDFRTDDLLHAIHIFRLP